MSHDHGDQQPHAAFDPHAKIIRMANQIATFFASKPHAEGVAGIAEHINKFWEPRMRRHFFEVIDKGGTELLPLVREAAPEVRRPGERPDDAANAGAPGGKGIAAGESKSEIAASQG